MPQENILRNNRDIADYFFLVRMKHQTFHSRE